MCPKDLSPVFFFFYESAAPQDLHSSPTPPFPDLAARVAEPPRGAARARRRLPARPDRHGLAHQPLALLLDDRSEEHTSELQSQSNLVCRLLLEKKKKRCPLFYRSPAHFCATLSWP